MKQLSLILSLTFLIGCLSQGGAESAANERAPSPSPSPAPAPVAGPSPSPSPAPSPAPTPNRADYIVGKWVDDSDPTEVWFFYNDGTGLNQKCAHTFTWARTAPTNWIGNFNFQIVDVQPALLINGCKPLTGNYPSSRYCNFLDNSSTSMRFDCNFQALSHNFTKVQSL